MDDPTDILETAMNLWEHIGRETRYILEDSPPDADRMERKVAYIVSLLRQALGEARVVQAEFGL